MLESKVYVQKRGNVYRVFLDERENPVPLSAFNDEPGGCFPFTTTSEGELRARFPHSTFVFLQQPQHEPNTVTITPEVRKQAEAILGKKSPPPSPVDTISNMESLKGVELSGLGPRGRAEEFLKRLQTALKYASKKHEKKLQAQVEIIDTLIKEIF